MKHLIMFIAIAGGLVAWHFYGREPFTQNVSSNGTILILASAAVGALSGLVGGIVAAVFRRQASR